MAAPAQVPAAGLTAAAVTGRGPYSGDPSGCLTVKVRSARTSVASAIPNWLVVTRADEAALRLLRQFRCLSAQQLGELAGAGVHSVRTLVARLCRLGLASRLDFAGGGQPVPSLYVEGPYGRRLLGGLPYADSWDGQALRALRLAASAQVYLVLSRDWGDFPVQVEPPGGPTALFAAGTKPFGVLAARLWPGETDWARDVAGFSADLVSLLLVSAGSREQAEELSRVIRVPGLELCFTWDGALFRNRPEFYRLQGRRFEPVRIARPS